MDEIKAAIIGAVVGAATAFIFGYWQDYRTRTRRKEAVATGLLSELYAVTFAMDTLRGQWAGFRVAVEMPTVIHDAFPQFIDLFDSDTVLAVLDMRGSLRDLVVGLNTLRDPSIPDEKKAELKEDVRGMAEQVIAKACISRRCLERSGGKEPRIRAWPSRNDIEAHVTYTKGLLKP
jgi:hypothetical protein